MGYSRIESRVIDLARPVVERRGYILYDAEYIQEGTHWYLRIYVDRDLGGVDLKDCEIISRELSVALDDSSLFSKNYFLEISSPGIERRLSQDWHFEKYIGHEISTKCKKRTLHGILTAFGGDSISIDGDVVLLKDIDNVRLKVDI